MSARSNRPTRDDQREPASTQKYAVQTEKPFQGSKGGPTSHADSARETYDSSFGRTYHDLPDREENLKLGAAEKGLSRNDAASKEPRTALEHYEQAVDSETAGKLGDSLRLYRRAFKVSLIERTSTVANPTSWMIMSTRNTRTNTFRQDLRRRKPLNMRQPHHTHNLPLK